MNDNTEQLQEVSGGNSENQGAAKCPNCGSYVTTETGSYETSRYNCMVFEYRCSNCGEVFEVNQ